MPFIDFNGAQRITGTHNRSLGSIMPVFHDTLTPPSGYAVANTEPKPRITLASRSEAEQWVADQFPPHLRRKKHR